MDAAIISTNASSDTGKRAIKTEVGIMQRRRHRLGHALKRWFRFGSKTTSQKKQRAPPKLPLHPFSRGSSRHLKSEKRTKTKTDKGNDTIPICVSVPIPADSEHAPLAHPSSSDQISINGTMEIEPPLIFSATVSTMQIANTVEKEQATTLSRELESSKDAKDVEKPPYTPVHKGTTAKAKRLTRPLAGDKQDISNDINGGPSFETLDTASRMLSEQTLGEKVIKDLIGAFGGIGVIQRAFNAIKFDKRSEPSSQVESDEEEQDTHAEAEPSIAQALDTYSKSYIDDSTLPDKIELMKSELTDSGSSHGSSNVTNVRSYMFHLWPGDYSSMSGVGHSKSTDDRRSNHSTTSSSSSSATSFSASSQSSPRSILTGAIIDPEASVRSRISQNTGSTRGTGAMFMQYSNTEYSDASEITTSSKSSYASGRSSSKSVDESASASSVATTSTVSQSIETDSDFVNRICEGVRTRIPDRVSKLNAIESEVTMNKPDTSREEREEGEASDDDQETTTTNTSNSIDETPSTSERSTGLHGTPSGENLVYTISKRSLSKAHSGFLKPEATESNIEVVVRTGSMDTESTSSTTGSTTSTPGDGGLVRPTSFLKFKSSKMSAEPKTDGRAIILSWNSI